MTIVIGTLAAALGGLHLNALSTLQRRVPCPVQTYRSIMVETRAVDLRSPASEPARRRFNAYYGVRRNAAWRTIFYEQFEAAKSVSDDAGPLFKRVIAALYEATGRVEASFASKLVATLRPDSPIIDSVVRGWLSAQISAPRFGSDLEAALGYYDWLSEILGALALTSEASAWSVVFAQIFPVAANEPLLTRMKQLDFLIWSGAPR